MDWFNREWEPFDFDWIKTADVDSVVGFGCMLAFGIALAAGV